MAGSGLCLERTTVDEVSAKIWEPFIVQLRKAGKDPEKLVEGLPVTLDQIQDPRGRLDWDVFAAVCERLEALCGGPEALDEIGSRSLESPTHRAVAVVAGLLTTPRMLYKAMDRWFGPSTFRNIQSTFEDLPDGRICQTLVIPDGYRDSPQFFRINAAVFRAAPRLIGLADSLVEFAAFPRRGVFTITPPPSLTVWARVMRSLRAFVSVKGVIQELGDQQDRLRSQYLEIRGAHVKIQDQARQLQTINALGHELTRQTEMPELVRAVVELLHVHCAVGRVSLWIAYGEQDVLRLLHRSGHGSDALERVYHLRAGGRIVGQLDVVFAEGSPQPGEALLEQLLPWIAVALDNARAFAEVRKNRALLEEKVLELERTRNALEDSQERYILAVRGSNDGLWDWYLKTGYVHFTSRWKAMLGHADEEVDPHIDAWFGRIHPKDMNRLKEDLDHHLRSQSTHFECEHRILHSDGTYRWMLTRGVAVRDDQGRAYRMAGSQTDVTDRKRAEEKLRHDAHHDLLTDLPNRSLFMARLSHAFDRHRRYPDAQFAVLFIDLDRFKYVNDSYGHSAGDELLVEISSRLASVMRASDMVARLGGDEFCVLVEDLAGVHDAVRAADRIQRTFTRPIKLPGREVTVTASIGIALVRDDYEHAEDLMRDADTALYRAKETGKARVQLFDPAMHLRAQEMLNVENDLRHAIDRGELELFYQPIVDLATGRTQGMEALIRWRHPERGLVSPLQFIEVAEETGLIVPIGRWVLSTAAGQLRAWQARHPSASNLSMSVNVSARQLRNADLRREVHEVLAATGLDPHCLRLEITESAVLQDVTRAIEVIRDLRSLGVRFDLDDFGTGYSSLSYLSRLPVNGLKIDRQFVDQMLADSAHEKVVSGIVSLSHSLNLGVTAEGVETAAHLNELVRLGCDTAQGYLFSRPVPAAEAEALLERDWSIGRVRPERTLRAVPV